MLEGIDIYGFVCSTMNGEIRLAIAIQIEFTHRYSPIDWLFENFRANSVSFPSHFTRKPDIAGDELHHG